LNWIFCWHCHMKTNSSCPLFVDKTFLMKFAWDMFVSYVCNNNSQALDSNQELHLLQTNPISNSKSIKALKSIATFYCLRRSSIQILQCQKKTFNESKSHKSFTFWLSICRYRKQISDFALSLVWFSHFEFAHKKKIKPKCKIKIKLFRNRMQISLRLKMFHLNLLKFVFSFLLRLNNPQIFAFSV
jgi:hypothetical protein